MHKIMFSYAFPELFHIRNVLNMGLLTVYYKLASITVAHSIVSLETMITEVT